MCLACLVYALQVMEALLLSVTIRTLFYRDTWVDYEAFRIWFYEIKRARPIVLFEYTPIESQLPKITELATAQKDKPTTDFSLKFVQIP